MVHGRHRIALGLVLALLALGCGSKAKPEAEAPGGPPRLLVLSSQIGYIEPCGCTVDLLLGGIGRIATLVEAEREKGPTAVLVVGPHLFEKAPPEDRVAQEEAKARLIGRSLQAIGVDAVVPTAAELVRGRPFYEAVRGDFTAPDVTVNAGGVGRLLTLGDLKVGVFGLAAAGAEVPGGTATDPQPAAEAEAARLRAEGAHVVAALGAMPKRDLRRLARQVNAVDLWILGDDPDELDVVSPAGAGYLIEAGDRGRNLGRVVLLDAAQDGELTDPAGDAARARKALELQLQMRTSMYQRTQDPALEPAIAELKAKLADLDYAAGKGKRLEYDLIPVTKGTVPRPDVAAQVAAYQETLKTLSLAADSTPPPVPEGKSGYAGSAACVDCHEEAHALWKSTPHGKAWQTLVDANKTFDPYCVSCHVTGWQQPGGAVLGNNELLRDVGCESCHGPGAKHVEVGGDEYWTKRKVPEAVCRTCHNEHHSPKFDYATYLPKILGPGHRALKD